MTEHITRLLLEPIERIEEEEGGPDFDVIMVLIPIGIIMFILLLCHTTRKSQRLSTNKQLRVPTASHVRTPFSSDFSEHIVTAVPASRPLTVRGVAVTQATEWNDTVVIGLAPYIQDSPPVASLVEAIRATSPPAYVSSLETHESNGNIPLALAASNRNMLTHQQRRVLSEDMVLAQVAIQ